MDLLARPLLIVGLGLRTLQGSSGPNHARGRD